MKIPSHILRAYQGVHTWTGIIASLFLFIGFFAGALTMFKEPIAKWVEQPSITQSAAKDVNYDALISAAVSEYPVAAHGFTLDFENHQYPMYWYEVGNHRTLSLNKQIRYATLDDNGNLVTHITTSNQLANLIDYLHRTAGLMGEVAGHHQIGEFIMGFAAILYFLALVSGLIFLLPTLSKSFFALRKHKGSARFWLDTHNLLGITGFPFHLVIALTAVVFAFHDFLYGGLSLIYGDIALFTRPEAASVAFELNNLPSVAQQLVAAQTFVEGYQVKTLTFNALTSTAPSLTATMYNEAQMMRGPLFDYLFMHPYTLEVAGSTYNPGDEGVWSRIVGSFFALHFGSYGGEWVRWAYFALGLGGAALFYTGNLLWLEKRRNKLAKGVQSRSYTTMAALTVGVCLGCILAVMSAMLINKLHIISAQSINKATMICYYLVFFAALALAFFHGAGKTAIVLLFSIAIVCALNFVAGVTAILQQANSQTISVEVIMLIFSVGTFYFGLKTLKRRNKGEQNSIWASQSAHNEALIPQTSER